MAGYLSTDPFAGQDSSSEYLSLDPEAGDTEPKKKKRTAADIAGDVGVTALKGLQGLQQSVIGLADLTTGGNVGRALEHVGIDGERTQKQLDAMYSEPQQEANRKLAEAEGFGGKITAALENPSTIATTVGESIPQMVGGMGVARRLMAASKTLAPWAAGAIGEGTMGAGSAAESIREQSADGLLTGKQSMDALGSGSGTALFGAAGGKLASKLNIGDIDTIMAQGGANAVAAGAAKKGFIRQVVESGVSEGVFEELPQSIQEQMWQNSALGKPLMEGVPESAAMGLLAGTAMGGAGGGYNAAMSRTAGVSSAIPDGALSADTPPTAPDRSFTVAPEPTAAENALLTPKALTALDRVNEIESADAQLAGRLAELDAPDSGYGPMFDQERAELATQRVELQAERAGITQSWPAKVDGADTTFSTEAGVRLAGRYALMEADDLQASHDTSLRQNPVYPPDLQPRERDRAASEMQVSSITQKLDPARLGESADAANGAPIIGADGLVESGNARTIALKRIYQANGLKAAEYRQHIADNAARFGITPESVSSMKNPVLVRVRTTPVNRAEFARQANAATVAAMSPSEQARADAARMEDVDGLTPDDSGDFTTGTSRDFVRRFMARLPGTEQAGMIDATGNLSQTGYARIRNAVLAKAYGDSPVLLRMVESLDDNTRNLTKALMQAAPTVAKARQAITEGALFDADITPDLMAAVEELAKIKDAGVSVHDALAQAGMFGEQYSPETRELLQFLADNLRRPRKIAEFITTYFQALNAAGNPAQGSLLGEATAPAKGDLLTAARRTQDAENNPDRGANVPAGTEAGAEHRGQPGDAARDQGGAESNATAEELKAANDELAAAWDNLAEVTRPKPGTLNSGFDPVPAAVALVRLFKAAYKAGTLNARAAARYVLAQIKKDPQYKHLRGTVDEAMLASAARVALNEFEAEGTNSLQQDLFAAVPAGKQGGLFDSLPEAKPAAAKPAKPQTWEERSKGNYKVHPLDQVVPADVAGRVAALVAKWKDNLPEANISADERVKAEAMLVDVIAAAQKDEPWFDERLKAVAAESGVGYQFGPTKKIGRTAIKLVDEKFNVDEMKDIVRATVVVNRYEDAQGVLDAIAKQFTVLQVNNKSSLEITAPAGAKLKNKGVAPEGYSDVSAFVALPGGGKAEIQINIPEMLAAKDAGHILYEGSRVVENDPARQGEYAELRDGQADLYGAAKDSALTRLASETEFKKYASSELQPLETGTLGSLTSATLSSSKRNQVPSGNLTNSSPPNDDIKVQPSGNLSGTSIDTTSVDSVTQGQSGNAKPTTLGTQKEPEVLRKARAFATKFHKGQKRKGTGEDYITHPAGLVRLLRGVPHSDNMLAAAWLHDTVEDTNATFADVRAQFGVEVLGLVKELTKVDIENSTRDTRHQDDLKRLGAASAEAQTVKLADIIHNTQNVREVDPLFADVYLAEKAKVLDVLTKGDATLMKVARGLVEGDKTAYDEYVKSLGEDNEHGKPGAAGTQGQGAGAASATDGKRGTGGVRDGAGGPDRAGDGEPGAADRTAAGPRQDAGNRPNEGGGANEHGDGTGARDGAGRNAGIPAGRDIPLKSGRNYAFGDADLTYEGSWRKKAEQNVEAVELLKKLETEGRQATRDEQAVLAKFIGWGASEIANSIFGGKLDKTAIAISEYESAVVEMDKVGRDRLIKGGQYRGQYADPGYYQAVSVLRASGKVGIHEYPQQVSRAELVAARPDMGARKWLALRDRLKAVMTDAEWADAARSTQNAHYTSKGIVKAMWRAAERMGFKGGAILEPGSGIGVFPGLLSPEMATNSVYTGIEMDTITGGILKQLFPDERILVESFIDSQLPAGFYDMAAGNPPFAALKVLADPKYKKYAFSLHDYFFAKTVDSVKPGGLVEFVTSRFSMDKLSDKARAYIAERADLVGAIRLPQTAFKQNAGTDVVTDVLFLRVKVPGETFAHAQPWAKSVPLTINGRDYPINEYFHAHPEMVLGKHADSGKMANSPDPQYSVEATAEDIEAQFDRAVLNLPENVYQAARGSAAEAAKVREIDFNPKAKKEGNYYVTDAGVLMQREGGVGVRAELKSQKDVALIKDFVGLRDALKQAHYDQLNEGDWETTLAALQKAYAAFTKTHGRINQFTETRRKVSAVDEETGEAYEDEKVYRRYPLLAKLDNDPDYNLVAALEVVNDDTGVISDGKFLQERVLGKPEKQDIKTPSDALLASLNDIGHVDLQYVADSLGISEKEAIASLGSLVYRDPSAGWVMADEYLSGNVKTKLKDAQEAAKADRKLERNVDALLAVQPAPVPPGDIAAKLGMNWIPEDVYADFLRELAGVRARVHYNARTGQWAVQKIDGHKTNRSTVDWGTPHRDAADILLSALTSAPIRITETQGSGADKKTVFLQDATEAANQKRQAMRDEFSRWLWQDGARTDSLVQLYNDTFNTIVPRSFDGRHLTLPGTSKRWSVFDHVKRGAWRIIQRGNTYLAHAVGSGKTFQMVIAAMEQKRLGLVKKPMMVVPNHMLQQFAREWQDLYPAARLMVADEKNFHTENRRRFVSRVALSDLDGVIITHSAFKLLDLDPEFKSKMIEQELDFLRAALEEAGEADDSGRGMKSPKVKQIEAKIERMEEKLKAAMSGEGKDKNVRFDELGVDQLFVDEAHVFRKLAFTTQRQVKGIDSSGSDQAFDLWMKTRWLETKNPGRSLVMASGTPVTNTLAELYSVQKFMANDVLEDRGIAQFDDWASMFGDENTEIEADASGKYSPVTRFTKFVNVPELTQMFREYADVLTSDHLAALLGDKRPKVDGGSRKLVITEQTDEYKDYKQELADRLEVSRKWKPSRDEPNNPDPVIRIIGDGRLAAIDMRFVSPGLPSNPESKLNRLIDNVIRVHQESSGMAFNDRDGKLEPAKGAAQMVFSDLGFGAGVAANRGFNARAWLEKRLRDSGIPASDVAFMSDYKKSADKLKLFKDVNAGRVRILIGSSKNMGTGVNAQQRLLALHHLDTPWFPADLEQREGRIIRQGNKNPLVQVYAFSTKGSYDAVMWQMLASKQRFIDQALSGDSSVRSLDDISESSQFQIATAMTSDDPRAIQLAGLRGEVEKLQRLYRAHEETRSRMRQQYNMAGESIELMGKRLPDAEKAAKQVQNLSGDKFTAKADGKAYTARKEWGEALLARYKVLTAKAVEGKMEVGEISGFKVVFNGRKHVIGGLYQSRIHLALPGESQPLAETDQADPTGLAMRAVNALTQIERLPDEMRARVEELKAKRNAVEPRLHAPFEFAGMLSDKLKEAADLEDAMLADQKAAEEAVQDPASEPEAEPETVLSTGAGGGIDVATLEAMRDRIAAKMENLPPVHVFASPDDDGVPLRLRSYIVGQDAMKTVEGAMHDGAIYLFASGLKDEARAEFVLAEHEVTHYGLRGMLGPDLRRTMQNIWANNARVRRAASRFARGTGVDQITAVEEVLADMRPDELAGLVGWRKVVGKVRDWFADHGFTKTAEALTKLLNGTMTQQAQADAMVADLVRRARRMVAGGGMHTADAMLSQTLNLASDMAEQEKWLTREAKARGFKDIDDLAEKAYPVFEKLAKKWREQHPAEVMLSIKRHYSGVMTAEEHKFVVPEVEPYLSNGSLVDLAYLDGKPVRLKVGKHERRFGLMHLLGNWAENGLRKWSSITEDDAENVARGVLELMSSKETVSGYGVGGKLQLAYKLSGKTLVLEDRGSEWSIVTVLPTADAKNWGVPTWRGRLTFPLPAAADSAAPVHGHSGETSQRQTLAGQGVVSEHFKYKIGQQKEQTKVVIKKRKLLARGEDDTKLSRGNKTASQRADDIIAKPAQTWAPLDKLMKAGTQVVGLDRLTRGIYNKAGFLLDRWTPETVKAGMVADYGVPGAVIDQRALMQGRQRVQMRKAGQLVDKLATLTRAESRVAYEWMNNDDPQAAAYFEQQLPAESLAVMNDVKKMIDSLSQEAVRLGQLDAETFKKNRFAYLRRSYVKHTAELTKHEAASRKRAIAVLGDQYKARGITDAVDQAKVQNIAPEWWKRKLQAGKADKGLKGEKFMRLEHRTHAGEGTVAMEGFGDRGPGNLREVAYWPIGQALPAKYKDWTEAGTWEVRDTKGGKLVMWRDFTKQERETMGEIDEARYAIAKTLHGMIHDVETGRYLQWLAERESKIDGDAVDGVIVDASERMRDTFKPGEWVRVPDTKIPGTNVLKYGKLAGRYLPGPVWNDVRQVVGGQFRPLGETYAAIHAAWKTSKTALSPAVHMNNVMANFVMADWHDVSAGHIVKALRLLLAANERDGKGLIGTAGNIASRAGTADREAATEIVNRYRDSGGSIGTFATTELQQEQLEPLLAALEKELGAAGDTAGAQVGAMVALQKLLHLQLPSAWDAFKPTMAGRVLTTEARNLIGLYDAEDQFFRLAAWLKAKEGGASDMEAGKVSRGSFLDYHINAPWVQMMRQTAFPFVAFTYRAVPMLLETAANKPWKLMKLGLVAGMVNALGYAALGLGGDDEDDERKLLPEEKAGKIWGMVPKLIRMPWNDENDSPVFLDVRRFVPVGDIFDTGATNSALPIPPAMNPGGPLALLGEMVLNKSQFTGKPITLETDTELEKAGKLSDHLYKAFAPNLVILPGTYAWTAVKNASTGKTDSFGREQSTAQALASSFGVKLGAYPKDVLQLNAQRAAQAKMMEIDRNITALKREFQRSGIDEAEFREKVEAQQAKKLKVMEAFREKM